MTSAAAPVPPAEPRAIAYEGDASIPLGGPSPSIWRRMLGNARIAIGGTLLLLVVFTCVATLPTTTREGGKLNYTEQKTDKVRAAPDSTLFGWFGYDTLGRSILGRCLLGGTISLSVGVAAALIAVVLGVTVGLLAGYMGGWIDSTLMRMVDILYGLPYVLLVILFKIGLEPQFQNGNWLPALLRGAILLALAFVGYKTLRIWLARGPATLVALGLTAVIAIIPSFRGLFDSMGSKASMSSSGASLVVLFLAIGLVSWLTMARVVRGQVLSLRSMPFIEACRAMGLKQRTIFWRHVLPNLVGPITVYATLTVPSAILQESFLSFLGVGVRVPLPTWGSLASEAVTALSPVQIYWWMLLYPCALLMLTLLCLNFAGDGLRDLFDPKREAAKL